VCPQKDKVKYFVAQRHQTVAKRSNLWHSDLRNNCESGYDYVFHLTCVMPIPSVTFQARYILVINNTVTQQIPQMQTFTQRWINTLTMNLSQNVLKMSKINLSDTRSETTTPLTDVRNNNWMAIFTARRVCIARTMPSQDFRLSVCRPSVRPSVTRRYCD